MELFARQPYETVTMETVAAHAGVSKMTVYSHFKDKETLFVTIVTSVSDEMIAAFPAPGATDEPLDARLTSMGAAFLTIVFGPIISAMSQNLPSALHNNPALAQRFYNAGPGRVRTVLAAIIAQAAEAGTLEVDSPAWAAEDLLSLWEGGLPGLCAFGLSRPADSAEIARRARRGTAVFLRAYGKRS
jgi:TetR/AcrR family transcriptional repressor of mexJK operon